MSHWVCDLRWMATLREHAFDGADETPHLGEWVPVCACGVELRPQESHREAVEAWISHVSHCAAEPFSGRPESTTQPNVNQEDPQ